MSQITDLLEKRKQTEICHEHTERNTCPCCGRWVRAFDEALAILKQPKAQPSSEFKATVAKFLREFEVVDEARNLYGVRDILHEACDRLDTSEASRKELLTALEEAADDFYYIHQHPEDAHVDSYNFMEKVKQAGNLQRKGRVT
jgi:hypothetical protein